MSDPYGVPARPTAAFPAVAQPLARPAQPAWRGMHATAQPPGPLPKPDYVPGPVYLPTAPIPAGPAPQPTTAQPPPPQSPPSQPQPQGPQPGGYQPGTQQPAPQPAPAQSPPQPSAPRSATPPVRGRSGMSAPPRVGLGTTRQPGDLDLDATLRVMRALGASDLHLTAGSPPKVRIDGTLRDLEDHDRLEPESLQRTLFSALTQRQREVFEAELELDFAYTVPGEARYRVNLYQQRNSVGAAFRLIPYEIKPLEELGIPPVVANFAGLPRGLVLVTGPTGSGKSTTLASVIDLANRTRAEHIMTVEDPIEFLHRHKKALVNQREVGGDTHSFANALRHVLRQDPDIILVGEMRDLETISVALTAAETGHLVFATLHTQDAAQSIDRMIDVFPAHQQSQVRTQLAACLQGVVSQTLCKRANGPGRVVATEVLIATPAVRNLIREGKTHQIYSALQSGASQGMHAMDQHLATLVRTGYISYETGLEKAHNVEDYNRMTGRFSSPTAQGASTVGGIGGGMGDPTQTQFGAGRQGLGQQGGGQLGGAQFGGGRPDGGVR